MSKAELWNKSVPRVELDQRARDARLRRRANAWPWRRGRVAIRLRGEPGRSRQREPLPVMPYFTKVRARANCDRGIWRGVCGSQLTGVSSCSWRTGAAVETIRSTRGLRADWSLRAESGTDNSLIGGLDVNSASAAWRALATRSRSSPQDCGCCCRLSKICSERLIHSPLSKGRFGKFGKLDLGSRGTIRKLAPMPQPRAADVSTE